MARLNRKGFSQEITIRDLGDNQRKANEATDNNVAVAVFSKEQLFGFGRYTMITDYCVELLQELSARMRGEGQSFNIGIALQLLHMVDLAKARPSLDSNDFEIERDGKIIHELVRCGCRVWATEQELADKLNVSRSSISAVKKALIDADIIVNWGEGWIEFDANLVWRGKHSLRHAYSEVQRLHPSKSLSYINSRSSTLAGQPDGAPS